MRFADIKGNESVKKAMLSMADTGKVAHAILLYEDDGCGALALVQAYLQYLNCGNRKDGDSCGICPSCRRIAGMIDPDVHYVFPVNVSAKSDTRKPVSGNYMDEWRALALKNPYFTENDLRSALGLDGKSGIIAISEAKAIMEKISVANVGDGYKAIVVWLPEKMNAEAANKLLKSVEEPPEKTLFVFITHNPDRVMKTVFSRCQSMRVLPLPAEDVAEVLETRFGRDRDIAVRNAAMSCGSIGAALESSGDREEYNAFLDIFSDLMNACWQKDLGGVLEVSERISSLETREKQKAFCIFAGECIRKIFLVQQEMEGLARIPEEEQAFYREAARRSGKAFCSRIVPEIDRSVMLLERNVNAKILFCDLACRIYLNV